MLVILPFKARYIQVHANKRYLLVVAGWNEMIPSYVYVAEVDAGGAPDDWVNVGVGQYDVYGGCCD